MRFAKVLGKVLGFTICVALAFCLAGCGSDGRAVATNSAPPLTVAQAAYQKDPVQFYLSINPPTTKTKDAAAIQPFVETAEPQAAFLQIFAALKRYPRVTYIRARWNYGLMSGSTYAFATYNRKTKILWYRETNFDWVSKGQDENFIYSGVTPQMLYNAFINGHTFENLNKEGCKLISSRKTTRP